ncbi:MAG: TIGR02757 family protein [Proteobacteria bacterium]|nr:TIGR02757 family protein [Pseudomonadota bacterium]
MNNQINKKILDLIYTKYNRRELVDPDPLIFLYNYKNPEDRELVGLIASSLAYGRVAQILKSVNIILKFLGPSPHQFLIDTSKKDISLGLKGFKHRFTTDEEMSGFLTGIKEIISEYKTLQNLFYESSRPQDENILSALSKFVQKIKSAGKIKKSSLLSDPEMGSACKRLNLYLRWMVRYDVVDPGGWNKISTEKLIVPLDTHMYYFGKCYGMTKRNNADMKTAVEITNGFKKFEPTDPTKYDFAITRFGIRSDMCWDNLEQHLRGQI